MYGTVAKVKALTNVSAEQLNQADQASLDQLLTDWLNQATSTINGYLQRDLDAEVGNSTTLAQAADTEDVQLTLTAAAKFGIGDYCWVGSGLTREYFEVADVDRATNLITLSDALRYDHAAGESVGRVGIATEVPDAVHSCAERMVANLVALAIQRRVTPLVKVDDFSVQLSSDEIFTRTLKDDLRPWRRRPGLFLA